PAPSTQHPAPSTPAPWHPGTLAPWSRCYHPPASTRVSGRGHDRYDPSPIADAGRRDRRHTWRDGKRCPFGVRDAARPADWQPGVPAPRDAERLPGVLSADGGHRGHAARAVLADRLRRRLRVAGRSGGREEGHGRPRAEGRERTLQPPG